MPRVPEIQVTRQLDPLQTAPRQFAGEQAFGADVADGVSHLAQTLTKLAIESRLKEDTLAADNAFMSAQGQLRDFLHAPGTGAYAQQGNGAAQIAQKTQAFMGDVQKQATKGLTPRQKEFFLRDWNSTAMRTMDSVASHERQQLDAAYRNMKLGLVEQHVTDIPLNRFNYADVAESVAGVRANVRAANPNASLPELFALVQERTTPAHITSIKAFLADVDENGRPDVRGASDYFNQFRKEIHPAQWPEITQKINAVRLQVGVDEAIDWVRDVLPGASMSDVMMLGDMIGVNATERQALQRSAHEWTSQRDQEDYERRHLALWRPGNTDRAKDTALVSGAASETVRLRLQAVLDAKYKMSAEELRDNQARVLIEATDEVWRQLLTQREQYGPAWQEQVEQRTSYWLAQGLSAEQVIDNVDKDMREWQEQLSPNDAIAHARRTVEDPLMREKIVDRLRAQKTQIDADTTEWRRRAKDEYDAALYELNPMTGLGYRDKVLADTKDRELKLHYYTQYEKHFGPPPENHAEAEALLQAVMADVDSGEFLNSVGVVDQKRFNARVAALPEGYRNRAHEYLRKPAEQVPLAALANAINMKPTDPNMFKLYEHVMQSLPPNKRNDPAEVQRRAAYILVENGGALWKALKGGKIADPKDPESYLPFISTTPQEEQRYTEMLRAAGVEQITPELLKLAELQDFGVVPGSGSFAELVQQARSGAKAQAPPREIGERDTEVFDPPARKSDFDFDSGIFGTQSGRQAREKRAFDKAVQAEYEDRLFWRSLKRQLKRVEEVE